MVSFWPFKGDDKSAASFEKILSKLASQISKASAQNERLRQNQRRLKALWTLYSGFAYILVAAILTLVTGYQRWGAVEYSAVTGGPMLIYGFRTLLDIYYNYRISRSQGILNDLYKQREVTILKLKEATKYDSTQQLLDKYGGSPSKGQPSPRPPGKGKQEGGSSKQGPPQGQVHRTNFAPPPTANIQRRQPGPPMPQGHLGSAKHSSHKVTPKNASSMELQEGPGEEFAPNAFSASPGPPIPSQPSTQYSEGPKWYDRIMDVILGEDEMQAKNRMVLICRECRLVNGQAPPGVRNLEDVGRWRCSSCLAWNGVESEEKKMLKQISGEPQSPVSPADIPISTVSEPAPQTEAFEDEDHGDFEHVEGDDLPEERADMEDTPPASSARSKSLKSRDA